MLDQPTALLRRDDLGHRRCERRADVHERLGQRRITDFLRTVDQRHLIVGIDDAVAIPLEDAAMADHAEAMELRGTQRPLLAAPWTAAPSARASTISRCHTEGLPWNSPSIRTIVL